MGTERPYQPEDSMTDHGAHDSLVWQALARLPVPVEQRVRTQLAQYLARVEAMAEAHERGVRVEPRYRRSAVEQFEAEADRLRERGDPAAPVWQALAESERLAEQVEELEPDTGR
jgi:aminoglycoside phosphotransferase (APT) family kinase protein